MSNHLCGLIAAIAILGACASSGDDVETTIDAPSGGNVDAPPGGNVDAPPVNNVDAPVAASGVGSACTGEGQGTCPTGFECLSLTGGSGSWCSKVCTGVNDQSCSVGYTGPGHASCSITVTPAGGGEARAFCAVLCFDAPGAPTYCPGGDAQCNMTCPTPLVCTAEIGTPAQARFCQ